MLGKDVKDVNLKKKEKKIDDINKLLSNSKIRRVLNLMKTIPIKSDSYICIGNANEGQCNNYIMISEDGYIMAMGCPYELDDANKIYKIDEVCMKRINPNTGMPPCQFLVSLNETLMIAELEALGQKQKSILYPQIEYKEMQKIEYEK